MTPRNTRPVSATTCAVVVKPSKNPVVVGWGEVVGEAVVDGTSDEETASSGFVLMDVVVVVESCVVSFDSIVSRY